MVEIARSVQPTALCYLEITSVIEASLHSGKLRIELLGRGHVWLDSATHESLLEVGHFVQTMETRHGLKVGCPELIVFLKS